MQTNGNANQTSELNKWNSEKISICIFQRWSKTIWKINYDENSTIMRERFFILLVAALFMPCNFINNEQNPPGHWIMEKPTSCTDFDWDPDQEIDRWG